MKATLPEDFRAILRSADRRYQMLQDVFAKFVGHLQNADCDGDKFFGNLQVVVTPPAQHVDLFYLGRQLRIVFSVLAATSTAELSGRLTAFSVSEYPKNEYREVGKLDFDSNGRTDLIHKFSDQFVFINTDWVAWYFTYHLIHKSLQN